MGKTAEDKIRENLDAVAARPIPRRTAFKWLTCLLAVLVPAVVTLTPTEARATGS